MTKVLWKLFFFLFKSQNFKLVTVGLWSGDPVGKSKQHWLQSSANLFFFFTFLVFIHSESSLSSSSFLSPLSSAAVVLVVVFVVVDDVVVVDVDHKSRRHFLLFKTNKQILQFLENCFLWAFSFSSTDCDVCAAVGLRRRWSLRFHSESILQYPHIMLEM